MNRLIRMLSNLDYAALVRGSLSSTRLRLIHPRDASIMGVQFYGPGTSIRIRRRGRLSLGKSIVARRGVTITVDGGVLTVGSGCFFNVNCSVSVLDKLSIGDNCSFGPNVVLVDHDHDFRSIDAGFSVCSVDIGRNVWVGANTVILKGSVIGDDAVIAAGSIVSGRVPARHVFVQRRESSLISYAKKAQ